MNFFEHRGFANQLLIGLLVTIGFGGSIGLGTVWLRHQVSVLADTNRALDQQITEIERHISDTKALVEEAQRRDILRSENEKMHLGLVEMTESQVFAVNEDPIARLVARANQRVFESDRAAGREAYGIHLDLDSNVAAAAPATGFPSRPVAHGTIPPANGGPSPLIRNPGDKLQIALSQ